MPTITHPGQAGTVESSDILIIIAPAAPASGVTIELTSPVSKQYGRQIKAVILETLAAEGVTDVIVTAQDKGALDCTIRARVKTAIARALA
ncbi:citrate lyase acyl carrier protein [Thermosinus carboxydivorans Nor1]|uniref:Citrate lyase acyl carrier protein n=1 Tax=Thermosinus carboxydivorans Nor1 TaxID=401526 RepID=A1HNG0_9FIRM|nr:citrate lyase acyl carrier protein [Thermosinus carboxydivorans]EAX48319.1 citrate lyase acyl carrier protein [Thermosinus carboxydivorans Nor1]